MGGMDIIAYSTESTEFFIQVVKSLLIVPLKKEKKKESINSQELWS